MFGMPISPLVFVAVWALVCAGAFVVGLRLFRMTEPPSADVTLEQTRRFGRLMMMGATAMLVFLGAVWLHGDLKTLGLGR
jgi:hypothetical protein